MDTLNNYKKMSLLNIFCTYIVVFLKYCDSNTIENNADIYIKFFHPKHFDIKYCCLL